MPSSPSPLSSVQDATNDAQTLIGAATQGKKVVLLALALLMLITAVAAIGIGPVGLHPVTVVRVLGHVTLDYPAQADWPASTEAIIWISRLPRVLMAMAVGSSLALAGVVLQAIIRNPLADPYVLGISSGASTGAAIAIVFFTGVGGLALLSGAAFSGALLATFIVLVLGGLGRGASPLRLILAGMAVGYAFSSITSFIIFASDSPEASRSVMFWMLGSLANTHWPTAQFSLLIALIAVFVLLIASRFLDALAEGDESALALGVPPQATRMMLMLLVSLVVAVMVAGAGSIGFIGLVVPHLARWLVGVRHRHVLPASALLGATVLLWADLGARTLFAPQEMAIGVVTGLVGAPLLLLLLNRAH